MTTYTFKTPTKTRTLVLHGPLATLDGEPVSQLEALRFLQDANNQGIKPEIREEA